MHWAYKKSHSCLTFSLEILTWTISKYYSYRCSIKRIENTKYGLNSDKWQLIPTLLASPFLSCITEFFQKKKKKRRENKRKIAIRRCIDHIRISFLPHIFHSKSRKPCNSPNITLIGVSTKGIEDNNKKSRQYGQSSGKW